MINNLSSASSLSSGDQFKVYQPNQGDERRISAGTLLDFVRDNVFPPPPPEKEGIKSVETVEALSQLQGQDNEIVYARQFASDRPHGGGWFEWRVGSASAVSGVIIPVAGSDGYWYRIREWVNVRDFGAVGDNIADDSVAFQDAINFAGQHRLPVWIPAGHYRLTQTIMMTTDVPIAIKGAGMFASRMYLNDCGFIRRGATGTSNINEFEMTDLGVIGDAETTPVVNGDYHPIMLNRIFRVRLANLLVQGSRAISLYGGRCDDVVIEGCLIRLSLRDGINWSNASRIVIRNNQILGCGDDAIAAHHNNHELSPRGYVRSEVMIYNNFAVDSGGIKALGMKTGIICNNVLKRMKYLGIWAGSPDAFWGEGLSTSHSIVVANNVIQDVIDYLVFGGGQVRDYIRIGSHPASSSGDAPAMYPDSTGVIEPPYGDGNYQVADDIYPAHSVIVQGNVCNRTMPAVTRMSEWGLFLDNTITLWQAETAYSLGHKMVSEGRLWVCQTAGTSGTVAPEKIGSETIFNDGTCVWLDSGVAPASWTMTGWADPEIKDADLRAIGVFMQNNMAHAQIVNNLFQHCAAGVFMLRHGTNPPLAFRDVIIDNNQFIDYRNVGVEVFGASLADVNVTITNNHFDGDPYLKHPLRNSDGSWQSSSNPLRAINVAIAVGVRIGGNRIANTHSPIRLPNDAREVVYTGVPNMIVGEPYSLGSGGYHEKNKGCGFYYVAVPNQLTLEIRGSDPTVQHLYGRLLRHTGNGFALFPNTLKDTTIPVFYAEGEVFARSAINAGGYRRIVCITSGRFYGRSEEPTVWLSTTPYANQQRVVTVDGGIARIYRALSSGTSGFTKPTGTGSSINDGSLNWAYVEPYKGKWLPLVDYVIGDYVWNDVGGTARIYRCITAGQSATGTGVSGTDSVISDGTVEWEYESPRAVFKNCDPIEA